MVGWLGLRLQVRPARLGRHPEDALRRGTRRGLRGRRPAAFSASSAACCSSKASEMYLRKMQAEDDVLVLGGVHAAAQGVGHLPELGFVADVGGGGARCAGLSLCGQFVFTRCLQLHEPLVLPRSAADDIGITTASFRRHSATRLDHRPQLLAQRTGISDFPCQHGAHRSAAARGLDADRRVEGQLPPGNVPASVRVGQLRVVGTYRAAPTAGGGNSLVWASVARPRRIRFQSLADPGALREGTSVPILWEWPVASKEAADPAWRRCGNEDWIW